MTNLTLSQRYRRIRAMENGSLLLHFSDCPKIFISGVVVAIQTQGRATTRYKQSANLLPIVVNCTATWYVLTFTGAASFCKRLATCWFMLCKHTSEWKNRLVFDGLFWIQLLLYVYPWESCKLLKKSLRLKLGKCFPPLKKKTLIPWAPWVPSNLLLFHLPFRLHLEFAQKNPLTGLMVQHGNPASFWCFNIPVHDNCHWFSKLYLLGKHGKSACFSPSSQGASA